MALLRRVFALALPSAVAALLVWLVLRHVQVQAVGQAIASANCWLLLAALPVLLAGHLLVVVRWRYLLRVLGAAVSYRRILGVYLVNLPIAKATPMYSGDYLRAMYLRDVLPLGLGAGSVMAEALLDLTAIGLSAAVGGLALGRGVVATAGSLATALGIAGFWLLGSPVASRLLRRWPKIVGLADAFALLRRRPASLAAAGGLTLLAWLPTVFGVWIALAAVAAPVNLAYVFAVQPIVTLVSFLPVTISGIGARETSMLVLYAGHAPAAGVAAIGLLYSAVSAVILPLICLPFTVRSLHATLRRYAGTSGATSTSAQ